MGKKKYRWFQWNLTDWFVIVTLLCINFALARTLLLSLEAIAQTVNIIHRETWKSQTGSYPEDILAEKWDEVMDSYDDWRFK